MWVEDRVILISKQLPANICWVLLLCISQRNAYLPKCQHNGPLIGRHILFGSRLALVITLVTAARNEMYEKSENNVESVGWKICEPTSHFVVCSKFQPRDRVAWTGILRRGIVSPHICPYRRQGNYCLDWLDYHDSRVIKFYNLNAWDNCNNN